jgi:hypothetical protein
VTASVVTARLQCRARNWGGISNDLDDSAVSVPGRVAVPSMANAIDSTIIASSDHNMLCQMLTSRSEPETRRARNYQGPPGTAGQPIKFDLEQEMIWGNNAPSTNQITEPTPEAIQIISSFRISPEGPRIRRMICNGASTGGLTRGRSAIGVALIGARAARGWPIERHCRCFVGASCNALSRSSIAPRGVAMAMPSQRI